MNSSIYGEIINGERTYKTIANNLETFRACLIGWTDEDSTHFDILFTLPTNKYGCLQRGLKVNDLYISIMAHSSFGFKTDSEKMPGYVGEKLNLGGDIADKVTELINGVIKELNTKEEM